jgi:hypothetical protein
MSIQAIIRRAGERRGLCVLCYLRARVCSYVCVCVFVSVLFANHVMSLTRCHSACQARSCLLSKRPVLLMGKARSLDAHVPSQRTVHHLNTGFAMLDTLRILHFMLAHKHPHCFRRPVCPPACCATTSDSVSDFVAPALCRHLLRQTLCPPAWYAQGRQPPCVPLAVSGPAAIWAEFRFSRHDAANSIISSELEVSILRAICGVSWPAGGPKGAR